VKFKSNANVLTANGDKVGEVQRVVVDPKTKQITHVVVRKGFLFSEDKVVPINLIASATDESVRLRDDAGDLEALPEYIEKHYVLVNERELGRPQPSDAAAATYWYPPFATSVVSEQTEPALAEKPAFIEREKYNIPEGTVALQEGVKVVAANDEHVGDVEEVLTDAQADRVTHFVIAEGLLYKDKKLVPSRWVSRISAEEIQLAVSSSCLERLPEYQN
jgi:uncharacterized protein YrrD